MFRILLYFIIAIVFSSCQLATFTSHPGVHVKTYPKALYGTYQSIEKHDGMKDTLLILVDEQGAKMNDPIMDQILNLSDSNNSLSHLGDFYFLNILERDSNGSAYWCIYPFEFDEKHLYIYTLSLAKTKKRIGKYLQASGRKAGDFKMENELFKTYCEKYLKKRKALKLKRIK